MSAITVRPAEVHHRDVQGAPGVDARALAIDLLNEVDGEVRFDAGSRALYATDASNYRQLPIGVVLPRSVEAVERAIAVARRHGAPLVNRGGGTALAGQTCNAALLLDFSKYLNRIIELDPAGRRARVEPGIVLDELRNAAEQHHLTFGPDPATHDHCTLGGMLGNNSCGVHSVMAGKTDDNVRSLEVLTYDGLRLHVGPTGDDELERICAEPGRRGDIYRSLRQLRDTYADEIRSRFPPIPRCVSGYNLPWLLPENGFNVARALVGSESTCVTILEAELDLVESPPGRSLLVLGYPSVFDAADDVPAVIDSGCIACEGLDQGLVDDMLAKGLHPKHVRMLPDGRGWLLVEFGGADRDESDAKARAFMAKLRKRSNPPSMHLFDRPSQEAAIWEVRESGLGATAMVPGKPTSGPGWEDSAVPPDRLGDYLRAMSRLFERYGYKVDLYGHFGQGVLHCRIPFDLTSEGGLRQMRTFMDEAADTCLGFGGSLSGEHGDGQARAELLPKMFGERLMGAFEEFKSTWDPEWRMNPGKLVRPYAILDNLRLGTDYAPPAPETTFSFHLDHDSFGHAAFRCVGVGECRRHEGGVMCPSYMVTREEKHSTRGRAHLLFELMNGGELQDGWRNEEVREALDLCLACKGCKGDCPVNVDMATYKAEYYSHYYAGRLRPRAAYSMGLIYWWAGLAARAPRLANAVTHAPLLGGIGKRLAGVDPRRTVPRFATRTFRQRFARRASPRTDAGRPEVILWPDTFNNHFHPETAEAAVEVLEAAGFRVTIPQATLCCGRPLYDWGMLGLAKRLLRQTLRELRPQIRAGVPVVGLEPSCVSVFRDELVNLFPNRTDARRLSKQTFVLSEFLQRVDGWSPPKLEGKAIVQGHCHHRSVIGFDPEAALLDATGLEWSAPEASCCGMAGAFGFEAGEHHDVAMSAGERNLLPAARAAGDGELVIADGFSCREQIEQGSGRHALHLAEVLQRGLHQ
ncbi:MAG TPA: FAD-binding and (Fe-S)-binding domain-containing protein [Candidatus Limnocylindria bacterium]|nr:FAD-binding and (Fe-S)-binding domain-containing protein [Candidatus Limnocylindria bacterium]